MKQSNVNFQSQIIIYRPIDKVWSKLIDVNNWYKWDTELVSANIDGEFVNNVTGTMIPKTGPKLNFYISNVIQNESYIVNIKLPVGHLLIKRILQSQGESTVFIDEIEFTGILKKIFGLFLGRNFKSILPDVLNNFKILVEKIN